VKLKLLDQGEVDLSTASGELSADLQALFAAHERRQLRERIKRGHEYRRVKKLLGQERLGDISLRRINMS
ncbi:recombinase family protein, partial [Kamptonema formosum]|uniref:recombinase family protein n=1 Tax=Kamptonema formosum TaxID=331992 RepID=UPI000475CF56